MMEQGERQGGRSGWRTLIWAAIAALLVTPLIAMQFTDQVRWTAFDFAVASALLIGAMVIYEVAARRVADPRRRAIIGGGLVLAVTLLWAQGAVGIL